MATEPFTIGGLLTDLRAEDAARDQRMSDGIFNLQLQQEQDYEAASGINALRTKDTETSPGEDVLANAQLSMNRHLNAINTVADSNYLTNNPDVAKYVVGDLETQKLSMLQDAMAQNDIMLNASLERSDPETYRKALDLRMKDIDAFVKKYSDPQRLQDDLSELEERREKALTDIEETFPDDASSFEKKLALAQFGLALAGGKSMGGKPFPILAEAGQQLIQNLAQINAQKKAHAKEERLAKLGVERTFDEAAINRAQQFDSEVQNMEWTALTQKFTAETNLADKIYEIDKENQSINNENLRTTYEKNFELYKDYLSEKYQSEPGVVQFISKKTGQPTMPMIGAQLPDGRLIVPADLNQHPKLVGADGLPLMVDIGLYADMSIDGGGATFSSGGDLPGGEALKVGSIQGFNDYQSSLNQTAAAMVGLSQLRTSLMERPDRAGWAGLARSVWQDAYRNVTVAWQSLTGEFATDDIDSQFYAPSKNARYYITDLLTEDLGTIQQEDGNGNIIRQSILSPTQKEGLSAAVNAGQQIFMTDHDLYRAAKNEGLKEFKLSDGTFIDMDQADQIFPSLYTAPNSDGYDPDLPRNEVRVQSLIYALARARKSSGRLNKDDIERASLTLNLYGKSDRGIDASLQEVQREFQTYIRDQISGFYQVAHNPKDKSGRDPFTTWLSDWVLRGNYIPAYLEPVAKDLLSESVYNQAIFRDVNDISIFGNDSRSGSTMDIQIQGEIVP